MEETMKNTLSRLEEASSLEKSDIIAWKTDPKE